MDVRTFLDGLPEPARRPRPPVRLVLARGLLEATQHELSVRSDGRREALVLWAGRPALDGTAFVSHLLMPAFLSRRDHLTIPPAERHALAEWIRERELLVFSDLHTHPRQAFLSTADIAAPFSTRDGFYATVVPDFASRETGDGWRMYEALAGRWREVSIKDRIHEFRV